MEKILIVEDESLIATDLESTLSHRGYEVVEIVATGEKAIKSAQEKQPDLVLMDIKLSGDLSGIDSARYITENFNIPIVYLTAHASDDTIQSAKSTNPFGYIVKPANEMEIIATIEMAIHKFRLEQRARESELRYRTLFDKMLDGYALLEVLNNEKGEPFDFRFLEINPSYQKITGFSREIIGERLIDIYPETGHDWLNAMKKVARTGETVTLENYLGELNKWFESVLFRPGKNQISSVVRDITDRRISEERLQESRARMAAILNAVRNHIIMVDNQYNIVWSNDIVKQLFSDDIIDKKCYTIYADRDEICEDCPVRETFTDEQVHEIEKVIDVAKGKKMILRYVSSIVSGYDYKGQLAVIAAHDITNQKEAMEELKRSQEELRNLSTHLQSVREDERVKIARDIHDMLGQALTALRIDLSWLSKKIPKDMIQVRDKISPMFEILDSTIQISREICAELRPGILDDLGLPAALDWQASEYKKRTGIEYELHLNAPEEDIGSEQAIAAFRIFQEAMTNVIKHADATKVNIRLEKKDGMLELGIKDNGIGISTRDFKKSQSYGIIGMRERIHTCGGEVTIEGKHREGTTVTVQIPLSQMN